jgi:hypothetical protein
VPKKAKPAKDRPLCRRQPPKAKRLGQDLQNSQDKTGHSVDSVKNPHFLAPVHFELKEVGFIQIAPCSTC